MTDPDKIEALKNSKLGAELSPEQVRVLSESIHYRNLAEGEVLVAAGTGDNHLYVIVSGNLRAVHDAGAEGEVTLFVLTAGDLVGELSFIDGTEHYASLVSRGNTQVFGIEREQLEALLKTDADIVYRVMRAIVRTVHQIQRRLSMQQVELTNYIYKQHGKY